MVRLLFVLPSEEWYDWYRRSASPGDLYLNRLQLFLMLVGT